MENHDIKYKWMELPCCCCGSSYYRFVGYRGGECHRNNLGKKVSIVRCRSCGHIYPMPMPVAENIDILYSDTNDFFIQHIPEEKVRFYEGLLERLENVYGSKGRLLDVGSGRGEMLYAAKKRGWDCSGVETCKKFADHSRSAYGIEVKNSHIEDLGIQSDYFDVVTLNAVIEHLYYPQKILSEISRVLKKGGLLYLDTSNEASFFHLIGNLYYKMSGKDWTTCLSPTFSPYHVQGFTKRSIKTLLLNAGFSVECIRLSPGKALLPHEGFKESIEHAGVVIIRHISRVLNMGRVMDVVGRKI